MSEETTRLIMRRTSAESGNKIAIRLDPDIDRNSALYELFRDGIVLEVMEIAGNGNDGRGLVTFGVSADKAFKIDRVENLITPRKDDEIGREKAVAIRSMDKNELESLDIDGINERVHSLRETEAELRHQLTRLKRDKSLASEAGYRHRSNDNFHRWVMLIEEIDIVTEQLELARIALQQVTDYKKARAQVLRQKRSAEYPSIFVRLAKEKMSKSAFEKLSAKAEEMAANEADAA